MDGVVASLPFEFRERRRDVADMILVEQFPGVLLREPGCLCRLSQGVSFRNLATNVLPCVFVLAALALLLAVLTVRPGKRQSRS